MGRLIDTTDLEGTAAAVLHNADGKGQVLLVCEHASNRIPAALDNLGLDEATRLSHVAWDPGALAVAQEVSRILDARLVASTVSRLVYDCNRPPEAPGAMPKRSEVFDIPGNQNLNEAEKAARVATVYEPFRTLLADTIATSPTPPVLVTIHSFTPIYLGKRRDVEIGILHDRDTRLADAMLDLAPKHTELNARRNDPYGPEDGVTHTLKLHALPNGLMNVMIEVRNDLIADVDQQRAVGKMLAGLIRDTLARIPDQTEAKCRA
ncbi:N-formylglutamate amidohydrolase [Profundibacter sp.]